MLNPQKLSSDIQKAFEESLKPALEIAMKMTFPESSEAGDKVAAAFAETVTDLVSEPLGQRIGNAIHAYIKNISITGTVITVGSMVTQTANIMPAPPVTAGKVPNTLGIL